MVDLDDRADRGEAVNTALAGSAVETDFAFVGRIYVDDHLAEIIDLERRIARADTDADSLLWQQAEHVAALRRRGMSQRNLARQWPNGRTGKPYTLRHVQVVLKVFDYCTSQPRPRFRDLYNEIANPTFGTGDEKWFSPREYVEAARRVLGRIDLDPASCEDANRIVQAAIFFTEGDDGLAQRWDGSVWMNPPFSRKKIGRFCDKLVASLRRGDVTQAIVLVRSDTTASWWRTLSSPAVAVSLPEERLRFWKPDRDREVSGRSNFGTALFYFGDDPATFCHEFRQFGPVATFHQAVRESSP